MPRTSHRHSRRETAPTAPDGPERAVEMSPTGRTGLSGQLRRAKTYHPAPTTW
jgi:hypothetical protein